MYRSMKRLEVARTSNQSYPNTALLFFARPHAQLEPFPRCSCQLSDIKDSQEKLYIGRHKN